MKPLILITNDDSLSAKGIYALIDSMKNLGQLVVVAPDSPSSGQSKAITVNSPIRISKTLEENGLTIYKCTGTPTDCVKLALDQILTRKPDLMVSGINHGSNSSISVLYSGTMGAALEGCVERIPSIGFSLCSFNPRADFSGAMKYANIIVKNVLKNGLPEGICLNVNIPETEDIKGVKICRQSRGYWEEEFVRREDPTGRQYFWLTGQFRNDEPDAEDTDEWALKNGYVSVVPCHADLTAKEYIKCLSEWNYE